MPATILIFSANPADTPRVDVDEEVRSIKKTIAATALRDAFAVELEPATRVDDFQTYLLRTRPAIVHFAGHGARGSAEGTRGSLGPGNAPPSGTLIVRDERGQAFAVEPEALARRERGPERYDVPPPLVTKPASGALAIP